MINYKYIPDYIKSQLRGYQAFKKIGVEFTNIHNNRQDCSAARSTMFTSQINHGIGDDVNEDYQYEKFPYVNEDFDTIGKMYKLNNYDLTAFYGKSHMDARMVKAYQPLPLFSLNTRGSMRSYGFDIYNTFGDTSLNLGIIGDNREFQSTVPPGYVDYDYKEKDMKLVGILPFLKARVKDGKSFHAQYHMVNPHDTMQLWQNTSVKPKAAMSQFLYPFFEEQSIHPGYKNPFVYNTDFPNAWINDEHLVKNFFEANYYDYITSYDLLPFRDEYLRDYVSNPTSRTIIPIFVGSYEGLNTEFSIANSREDVKSWKNLINNYYGLIMETDEYIYQIYKFLEENDMLKNTSVIITADHGDQVSSHGLKQKGYPFKESVNIPFIVYSPHMDKKYVGETVDTLGCHLDLNPTLEVLSKLDVKSNMFRGRSLVKWVDGKLKPSCENKDVIQICNSTMHLEAGYTGYLTWKKKNGILGKVFHDKGDFNKIKSEDNSKENKENFRIVFEPKNMFEFQYCFIMLIHK